MIQNELKMPYESEAAINSKKLGHALAEGTIFQTVALFVSKAYDCFTYIAGVLYKVGDLGRNLVHVFVL